MVHCSSVENEDLFWALRGAGSSFGIVVEFEFQTFAAPKYVTPFAITQAWTADEAPRSIAAIQSFIQSAPKEIGMVLFMRETGQSLEGIYYGNYSRLASVIQPLLQHLATTLPFCKTMGWIDGLEHFAPGNALNQTPSYARVCAHSIAACSTLSNIIYSTIGSTPRTR